MKQKNRSAKFTATLVYYDEPLVILGTAGKSRVLGVAVPSKFENKFLFVSVSQKDWENYIRDALDLRYLFLFPKKRSIYYSEIKSFKPSAPFNLVRFEGTIPEDHLPETGFFASQHTEPFSAAELSTEKEKLNLAGQWELQDFGSFQQKFTDVYSFSALLKQWVTGAMSAEQKAKVLKSFLGKPLRGGSSYGSLFSELENFIPRQERIHLGAIKKASPGWMEMRGSTSHFEEVEEYISYYLANRSKSDEAYAALYQFLQNGKFLRLNVEQFAEDNPTRVEISALTACLADAMGMDDLGEIRALCDENSLASAKVVLALHRRISGTALFFAQGRVAYN